MKEKSETSHMFESIIWFILSMIMVAAGVVIIIPILEIYGVIWTAAALLVAVYHGNNIFSRKKFHIWEATSIKDKDEET